jgi:CHAT domain-containing protein/tetratricopeptide (TPR) repeat protein
MRFRAWPVIGLFAFHVLYLGVLAEAQTARDPEFAQLMAQGRSAFNAARYQDAQHALEQALQLARNSGVAAEEGEALLALADVHYTGSRYAETKATSLRALEIADAINHAGMRGRAHLNLGLVAERLAQPVEARKFYEAAVADLSTVDEPGALSMALLELISAANDDPRDKPERFQQALELSERIGDKARVGRVLHSWGDRLFFFGENEAALEKYQLAVAAYSKSTRSGALGTVYNSIGRLYRRHEQYETALEYQKRALRIHEQGSNPFSHMQSLNAVGVTLQSLGREREAMSYLEKALAVARATKDSRAEDFVSGNLASSLIAAGEFEKAAQLLEGVVARKLDAYPSLRHHDLAKAYLALGQVERAMDAANQSIVTCGTRADIACLVAYDTRAQVHLARHDRSAARADLEQALNSIEDARKRLIPADFFKQQFGASSTGLYGTAIELQLADGDSRLALETAEQGRARAFMDLLASQEGVPSPVTATAVGDNTSQRRSEQNAPSPKANDLTAIAARLQSTLLVYWAATDRLFIWTVPPSGSIRATTVPVREARLAELVASTGPFGNGDAKGTSTAAWRSLYDVLIKPIRDQLPTAPGALVTVVPHGPLAMLSFAALQDQRSRYLIEDYTLHYVPAAGILQFTETRKQRTSGNRLSLVVADPKLPQRSALARPLVALPGAREEARAIAQLAPKQSVITLEGDAASEASVREKAGGKAVLHFATHAIVSDTEPFASFLALARSDATSPHDGTLTAQEIYGLQLQADLVVLSACRSGGGRVTGDGLSTFARAFLYAGAPSLITSVWDVADESTSHLVPEFYRAWHGGSSKARALRSAQLKFLSDLRKGTLKVDTAAGLVSLPEHPALWAGFMLIGEPD